MAPTSRHQIHSSGPMKTPDINTLGLLMMLLLLAVPLALDFWLKLKLAKDMIISVARMLVQLALMGIFLEYLIKWDAVWLNMLWFLVMVLAASHSAIKRNKLSFRKFWKPIFGAMVIAVTFAVLYFNSFIIHIDKLFSARYFVIISGMILGNSMKGIIIVLDKFYTNIIKEKQQYFY
ncbi:MAG TPA: ABC transporter permease, partial [Saprospiraceae bacterium]|nr:ABC transporter permease [Saprospiraceae bacterium]